jgi:hypothetical protein
MALLESGCHLACSETTGGAPPSRRALAPGRAMPPSRRPGSTPGESAGDLRIGPAPRLPRADRPPGPECKAAHRGVCPSVGRAWCVSHSGCRLASDFRPGHPLALLHGSRGTGDAGAGYRERDDPVKDEGHPLLSRARSPQGKKKAAPRPRTFRGPEGRRDCATMVEVGGVEPPSENLSVQVPTCVSGDSCLAAKRPRRPGSWQPAPWFSSRRSRAKTVGLSPPL